MIGNVRAGIQGAARRPGLVLLLHFLKTAAAIVLALPIFYSVREGLGDSGFGPDLAAGFDVVVWADLFNVIQSTLTALPLQFLLVVPFVLIWKTAMSVGVINAVRDGYIRGFWEGVGRYSGKALLLALPFVVVGLIALVGLVVGTAMISAAVGSEVIGFWMMGVALPILIVLALGLIDLMHDYSRISLVVRDNSISKAFGEGVSWPFRRRGSLRLYLFWFVIAAVLLVIPLILDSKLPASTTQGVWVLFGLQQLFLLLRATVTVAWFGSEVEFFEAFRWRDEPLIAPAEAIPPPPTPDWQTLA